jgi:hypothetical protein
MGIVAVNSVHPQTEQKTAPNFLEACKRRFPLAKATQGSGEFCVTCCSDGIVRLFETFESMAEFLTSHPGARRYHWEPKDLNPPKVESVHKANYGGLYRIPGDGQDEKD